MAKADARMAKADARMDKSEARMDKFERGLEAIRKLIHTGMKLIVKIEKSQAELAEAQRRTDRKLDRLIDSWGKRPANGHRPKG